LAALATRACADEKVVVTELKLFDLTRHEREKMAVEGADPGIFERKEVMMRSIR